LRSWSNTAATNAKSPIHVGTGLQWWRTIPLIGETGCKKRRRARKLYLDEIDTCSDQAAKLESDGADSNRERK